MGSVLDLSLRRASRLEIYIPNNLSEFPLVNSCIINLEQNIHQSSYVVVSTLLNNFVSFISFWPRIIELIRGNECISGLH